MKYFKNAMLMAAYYSSMWINTDCLHIFQLLKILISLKLVFKGKSFIHFIDGSLSINSWK